MIDFAKITKTLDGYDCHYFGTRESYGTKLHCFGVMTAQGVVEKCYDDQGRRLVWVSCDVQWGVCENDSFAIIKEGIPDGWELVRVGKIFQGEHWVNNNGQVNRWDSDNPSTSRNYVIIRKIEKPKKYRPFANAAEFEPHRDRWIRHKSNADSFMRCDGYGNKGITVQGNAHDFSRLFDDRTFDDGTPFGVEVTE